MLISLFTHYQLSNGSISRRTRFVVRIRVMFVLVWSLAFADGFDAEKTEIIDKLKKYTIKRWGVIDRSCTRLKFFFRCSYPSLIYNAQPWLASAILRNQNKFSLDLREVFWLGGCMELLKSDFWDTCSLSAYRSTESRDESLAKGAKEWKTREHRLCRRLKNKLTQNDPWRKNIPKHGPLMVCFDPNPRLVVS